MLALLMDRRAYDSHTVVSDHIHTSKKRGNHRCFTYDLRNLGTRTEACLLGLHQANELESLWKSMIALIDTVLPVEHLVAALPYEGLAPMAIRTTMPHDDNEAFWQKLNAADPPLFKIIQRFPGIPLADLDDYFSEQELTGSRFYREIMAAGGWRHIVVLVFWNGPKLAAHVGIWRTVEQGCFSDEEKRMLMAIRPHLEAAIRRVAMIERLEMVASVMADALEHPSDDGIVLLDAQGKLVFRNHAALVSCAVWKRGWSAAIEQMKPVVGLNLPECIRDAAMNLLARFLEEFRKKQSKGSRFETEIHHPGGEPISAKASVIAPKSRPVHPHVKIEFSRLQRSSQGEAAGVPVYRLSRGEHRVALLVARGMSNHEVAVEAGISVNTVRAHLREIFSKLGITHRGQLVDRLSRLNGKVASDFGATYGKPP